VSVAHFHLKTIGAARLLVPGVLAACAGLLLGSAVLGQVTPEEHEKHHGGKGQGKAAIPPVGPKQGMMGGMGANQPKELYPSLMNLPDLSPQQRAEVQRQAHERMKAGTALLSQGLDKLSNAAAGDDYAAMQEATSQMREGLALFESGLAAHRALAEGKAPRDIALQWFKGQMSLYAPPTGTAAPGGPFGLSWFHFFVMVILAGFAAVMIWMYFHKMRRASELLARLTSAAPTSGAGVGGAPAPPPRGGMG
jgi:hypothetical protein